MLSLISTVAGADPGDPPQSGVELSNVSGAYLYERDRETHEPIRGFSTGLTVDLNRYLFVGGNYADTRTNPFTDQAGTTGRLEYRRVGGELGAGVSVLPHTDISATVGYVGSRTYGLDNFQADPIEQKHSASGSLNLGYRVAPAVQLWAGRVYSYIDRKPGWETQGGVGLRLMRNLWVDGSAWRAGGAEGFTVGLRASAGD
jgi:hypothetical protein